MLPLVKWRSLLERAFRLASLVPNRKFATTRAIYSFAGLDSGTVSTDELVRRNVAYTYSYYGRLARLGSSRYRRHLYRSMRPLGLDSLAAAQSRGLGVILLSAHLGDFDVAGAWLAEVHGIVPVVTASPVSAGPRQAAFDGIRRSCGVVLRRQNTTGLAQLAQDLRQGRAVLMMVDRKGPGRSISLDFLGHPAEAPAAACALAAATGAPLMSAATWRLEDGHAVLCFGAAHAISRSDVPGGSTLQAVADDLTRAVMHAPHQFHVPADASQMSWHMLTAACDVNVEREGLRGRTHRAAVARAVSPHDA